MRSAWLFAIAAAACQRRASEQAPVLAPAPSAAVGTIDAAPNAWRRVPDAGPDVPDARAILARVDLAARRKALHGAWVDVAPTNNSNVYPEAIGIDDAGVVREWDGRQLKTYRLGRNGFCTVNFDRPPTYDEGIIATYLVHDGKAEVGIGDAGERVAGGAIVCADELYVLDDAGRCGRVSGLVEPARCGFRTRDGDPVFFFVDSFARERELPVDDWKIGDVANGYGHDVAPWVGAYPDFEGARAVVDRDADANDPLPLSLAAGGKVGDVTTVPGVIATYATDQRTIAGKSVQLRGVVVGHYGDGILYVADPEHRALSIGCYTGGAASITDGAAVTVEGTVGQEMMKLPWTNRIGGAPDLESCRVR